MSRTKKDVCVILFDKNRNFQEKSLQALMKIVSRKFFTQSNDFVKIFVFDSEKSGNEFEPIVANDAMKYEPAVVFNFIKKSEPTSGNWLKLLSLAIESLKYDFECSGTITSQLLIISDMKAQREIDSSCDLSKIASDINDNEIFLYIIGPKIEPPFFINSNEFIKPWMKSLKNTQTENPNLLAAKELIARTENSVICNLIMGYQLFFSFKKFADKQKWLVPLSIGSKIEIAAETQRGLNQANACKLQAPKRAASEFKWIDAEDESVEIDPSEIINGVLRHGIFVPIVDEKMFKPEGPRSFTVLGFTSAKNIPEYLMRGDGSYYVLPPVDNCEAFLLLLECLDKENKFAIARRVYCNNYIPKHVVLIPKREMQPNCFLLVDLPYADDIKFNYQERKLSDAPYCEKNEEIYNFLDSIDVNAEIQTMPLSINMIQNVNADKLINKAADKYLDKYLHLEELDLNYLNIDIPEVLLENVQKIWPQREEEVEQDIRGSDYEYHSDYDTD